MLRQLRGVVCKVKFKVVARDQGAAGKVGFVEEDENAWKEDYLNFRVGGESK